MQSEQKQFKLHSEYQPTGDQPQAIEALVEGFKQGNQCETLLGVTGSGKTFTMANVIAALNKPTTKPWRARSTASLKNFSGRCEQGVPVTMISREKAVLII